MKEPRQLTPEENERFLKYYFANYEMILKCAKRKVQDHNIAEIVAQETFETAWENIDDFFDSKNPSGWLVLALSYKCKQALRDKEQYLKHLVFVDDITQIPVHHNPESELAYVPDSPEKRLLYRFYMEGYTIKELAEEENCKTSAMKMRLLRAREKIKEEILKLRNFIL